MPADQGLAALSSLAERNALLRAAAALIPGDSPRLDAELLLAHLLGLSRLDMLMGSALLADDVLERFCALVARRQTHEPVAQILGEREFWSLPLKITADVLVPRPDSETLIAEALALRRGAPPMSICDLGTGSGALLLAALSEWPAAFGLGVDRSEAAVAVARANAQALGLDGRAHFLVADWATALDGRFDLLFCNPPYIPDGTPLMPDVGLFEPPSALFAGADGLDCYRLLFPRVSDLLAPGGAALFEFGEGQADAVLGLAAAAGLGARIAHDLGGQPRAIILAAGVGR